MELKGLTDEEFDSLYPIKMKKLSGTHWTPVDVARKAIQFLDTDGVEAVLDLGSGAGKFCLIAGSISKSKITGVEQRENLVQLSRKLAANHQLQNVNFIHDDLQNLDFGCYDAFYFFNAFEENINLTDKLDKDTSINLELYHTYIKLIREKFESLPAGTRIVTYCGDAREIPDCYRLVKSGNKGKLRYWEKEV
ncbi:methyltransferase family protein [Algoriphagus ratkowskyi]|uniref:Class I SAM-dependent methyltransferase n=1 Tax=Algoriphagus ratkowskyi TaxID=57028 RepID=A0A2W7RHR1_9BACT|nr:class I SAM-dependent methyltransferase [Algoriphagus ratkowskyi]PZX60423.1 methyltransferase family protein [Algoriphagus ratkowskyi]TXD78233.1 class I SAM-dependent methyltransferase [Algoriphagus ratkowskyi]